MGGPIHPLQPRLHASRFPFDAALAIHVRVQGSGEATLAISVVNGAGQNLTWGAGLHEAATTEVSIPDETEAEGVWEDAVTAILPRVRFPSAGRYTVRIDLLWKAQVMKVHSVDLPIEVWQLRPPTTAYSAIRPRLTALAEEMETALTPGALRALRLAGAEAHRLGAWAVETQHLVIALRRVLGPKSSLPSTALLREALERISGVCVGTADPDELVVAPVTTRALRDAVAVANGSLDPEAMLKFLLAVNGFHTMVVAEARLLAKRRPR